MEYLQTFFGWIWGALKAVLVAVIGLLPNSPFQILDNSVVGEYLGYINWLIPINQIITILQLWLAAIIIFYVFSAIMRWIKAIQ